MNPSPWSAQEPPPQAFRPSAAAGQLKSPEAAAQALAVFFRIAQRWNLGAADKQTVLGVSRTVFFRWQAGQVTALLDASTAERLSYIFRIYAALQVLLPIDERADAWVHQPNSSPLFGGGTALARMLGGRVGDLKDVADFWTPSEAEISLTPPAIEPPWQPCYRAIPSRFPPVSLFDRVARPEELEAVFAIQALTNPRLRDEWGEIGLVPAADRVSGPGSTPVMAAFTHLNREGSRFSDGTWGMYYAAESLDTAVAEVGFHCARFMSETRQPPIDVDYRAYAAQVVQPVLDLRGPDWVAAHAPDDYQASRARRRLRGQGAWGVAYRSVRRVGGECMALFRPKAIQIPVIQSAHVTLCWDGKAISGWYRKSDLHSLPTS